MKLQTYSKEPLNIVGAVQVHVEYDGQTAQLTLIIVKGDGPTLLGRDWLSGRWHCSHARIIIERRKSLYTPLTVYVLYIYLLYIIVIA